MMFSEPFLATIAGEVYHKYRSFPDAPAILNVDGKSWSYTQLWRQIEHLGAQVQSLGVATHERVALAMPNGPQMALTFLGVSAVTGCAPLNPDYRRAEYIRYLEAIEARALLVAVGKNDEARSAAASLHIPVWELTQRDDRLYTVGLAETSAENLLWPSPEDVALILHTSGTTAFPKQVPLTHRNLSTSASNISATLHLTPADRCLNVMPLFHIHGLVAGLLAPLFIGGSVVCPSGFSAVDFPDWLARLRPTWYTAVPTMHQTLLARIKHTEEYVGNSSLRFIRSSSASLPPAVLTELEDRFGVPVIEAYGMTEATHQITSNPLPPGERKAGSVGVSTETEVGLLDENGAIHQKTGVTGEVVIRGASVTAGYAQPPDANATAFVEGWFRTGDLGCLDRDGYLFLLGRLKEMINRGGEKVAPREIEEAILSHPAVAQVVCFAMPDDRLGEDIAAAVVVKDGATTSQTELQQWGERELVHFKVPRRIIFVEALPTGGTGKLQRIGLAQKLGLVEKARITQKRRSPIGPIEQQIAAIWCQILQINSIDASEEFMELGGDSLQAMRIAARVQDEFGVEIPLAELFAASTVAEMALVVLAQLVMEDAPAERGLASDRFAGIIGSSERKENHQYE